MERRTIAKLIGWLLLISLLLGAGWIVARTAPSPSVLNLQFAGFKDAQELHTLLYDDWGAEGRGQARRTITWDFLFIVSYVGVLLALTQSFVRRRGQWLIAFGRSLLTVPIAAGLFDVVENFLMLDLLLHLNTSRQVVLGITSTATIKFGLIALSSWAILKGLSKRLGRWRRSTRGTDGKPLSWRAILWYGLKALPLRVIGGDDRGDLGIQPSDEGEALTWDEVLAQEQEAIRRCRKALGRSTKLTGGDAPVGLALSGGGIRSATFNLGILQALAKSGGLTSIDYLSTVSGGGYIGSWLSKWIRQEGGAELVQGQLARGCTSGGSGTDARCEPKTVSFLRRYSNYLTPKTGLFSADTWTTVATFLRNLILNQTILLSGGLALLMLPRLLAGLFYPDREFLYAEWPWWCLLVGILFTLWALLWTGFNLAYFDPAAFRKDRHLERARSLTTQTWVVRFIVVPLALAALFASYWLHRFTPESEPELVKSAETSLGLNRLPDAAQWIVITAVLYAGAWAISLLASRAVPKLARLYSWAWPATGEGAADRSISWRGFAGAIGDVLFARDRLSMRRLVLWGSLAGAVGGGLLWLCKDLLGSPESPASIWRVIVLGPPLVLGVITLSAVVHIGLMGTHLQTGRREWMARVGAWLLIFGGGWLVFSGIAVYGPVLIASSNDYVRAALASGWLASTIGGLLMGRSPKLGGGDKNGLLSGLTAKVVPYVFIIGLIALLALGLDAFLTKTRVGHDEISHRATEAAWEALWPTQEEAAGDEGKTPWLEQVRSLTESHNALLRIQSTSAEPLILALLFSLTCVLLARRVDINEYSMHHYYRNRLIRCYLGASMESRDETAQLFTGFNLEDDLALAELAATEEVSAGEKDKDGAGESANEKAYAAPYLIVNTTLNLVNDDTELAWQERKAASFTLTPLHCGFSLPEVSTGNTSSFYRYTTEYAANRRSGGSEKPGETSRGLSLGTAMAISGAAVTPNMGYHSSPALTFLLTVFNIRLGWWLGNPRDDVAWRYAGPRFGLFHLVAELFGQTSSKSDYVYLSDGGHFENIGIYELVRRKCRIIVACDCGADRDRSFADLGNAIRKCRVDLGAEITFDQTVDRDKGSPYSIATIDYPDDTPDGRLIVIKPTVTGADPTDTEDVRSYSASHGDFPQRSTADQWFDESQFESYRQLGYTIGSHVFDGPHASQARFIRQLEKLKP